MLFEEWWGLDDRIKATADRLASHGFDVLVPDLYRGRSAATGDEANHLMQGLDFNDAATQDVPGAGDYLRDLGAKRVGVLGFCMGGALAMLGVMNGAQRSMQRASGTAIRRPRRAIRRRSAFRFRATLATEDGFFAIGGVDAIENKLKAAGVAIRVSPLRRQTWLLQYGRAG